MQDDYNQEIYVKNEDGLWRFDKVELPFSGKVSLANMTAYTIHVNKQPDEKLLVSIEGKGAFVFGEFVHWTYAQEKLNLYPSDAKSVADFINAQLGDTDHQQQNRIDLSFV